MLIENLRILVTDFLERNTDLSTAVQAVENMIGRFYMRVSKNTDEYVSGHRSRSRIILVTLNRLACFVEGMRFIVADLFKTPLIESLMCHYGHIFGNRFLSTTWLSCTALVIFTIAVIVQVYDMKQNFHIMDFFYHMKHDMLVYPLSRTNSRRLAIRMNLITKYAMGQTIWISIVLQTFVVAFCSFYAYLDPLTNHILAMVIIWNVICFVFTIQCFCILWMGVITWYSATLYLKYKFNEINRMLETSYRNALKYGQVNSSHIQLLTEAIVEHNHYQQVTHLFNEFFSNMIFIIYYIATPGFEVVLFGALRPETSLIGRFTNVMLSVCCFSAVIYMHLMNTWVCMAAHHSYQLMYSYLTRVRTSTIVKLKITAFVEKLSGPDIGFYCLDLFPMNNYEFFQYVYYAGANYFLIMSLF